MPHPSTGARTGTSREDDPIDEWAEQDRSESEQNAKTWFGPLLIGKVEEET